jgi:SAM-dependent methyltransferase
VNAKPECSVCGGKRGRVVWRENGYEGRACPCGTVCTTPEPAPHAIDPSHDAHSRAFYALHAPLKVRWIERVCRRGRLLEIGCGEGDFLIAAQARGFGVTGIEIDPARAARAAQRVGSEVRCASLEDVEWPGAAFDVVYHCDLLSHFANPLRALLRMTALLGKNGVLAFEVGTLGGIHPAWYRWIGKVGYPQHRWLFSERSLFALLERAGLMIEAKRHFGLAPAVTALRARAVIKKVLARTGREDAAMFEGSERAGMHRAVERVDQFLRYRVGALAPRLGPATWLIAARPVARS